MRTSKSKYLMSNSINVSKILCLCTHITTYLCVGASYRHSARDFIFQLNNIMKSVGIAEVWVVVGKTLLMAVYQTPVAPLSTLHIIS